MRHAGNVVSYVWPGFRLEFEPATGRAITRYPDGTWSGCGVVPEDRFHAARLGITPELHRLQHELAHHLVGFAFYGFDGSPVLWRDAHGIPQESGGWVKPDWSEADREEWLTNMLQYRSRGREFEAGAAAMLKEAGADVDALCSLLAWLLDAPARGAHVVAVSATQPPPKAA